MPDRLGEENRTALPLRQGVHGSAWTASEMRQGTGDRDDVALLRAAARGDEDALAALYDRHAGWLTIRLARRCGQPDVVDQAVQDTFLALWRGAGNYRGGGDVAAFVWGIGIRRLIDLIRREGGQRHLLARRAERPQLVVSAEDQVLAGIEHGHLGQALADLPPELRAAIEATVLDGLTCAEAAVLLGVAEGTVKSRCHRARQALRAALTEPQAGPHTHPHRQEAWGTP
jgi:RNA polymerase sigma-70 factor, ECF subfamily